MFSAGLTVGAFVWGLLVDIIGRRWAFNLTVGIVAAFGEFETLVELYQAHTPGREAFRVALFCSASLTSICRAHNRCTRIVVRNMRYGFLRRFWPRRKHTHRRNDRSRVPPQCMHLARTTSFVLTYTHLQDRRYLLAALSVFQPIGVCSLHTTIAEADHTYRSDHHITHLVGPHSAIRLRG